MPHAIQESQPEEQELAAFRDQLKDQMHTIVQGLNVDNFIVRKQRPTIENFQKREQWNQLSEKDVTAIHENISGLPWVDDDHETARRFDLMIYNLQVAILQKSAKQANYQKAIREIAANLEEKKAIPMVAAQMELILELQTDSWWQDVTLPILESVRQRMRELAKFIEKQNQEIVYTDFEDSLIGEDAKDYEIISPDSSLQDYRVRVEKIIRQHQDHVTIRRLKNNEPVSQKDIEALEEMLFVEEKVPRDEYEALFGGKPVGLLVRSVVGLDRNAAKHAFAEFLETAPLHPDQISFLNEVVEYLVKNGIMEPKAMFDSPFTHHNDKGVVGIMGDEMASKIVDLVRRINKNAEVA